jgi:hypothetical protein
MKMFLHKILKEKEIKNTEKKIVFLRYYQILINSTLQY